MLVLFEGGLGTRETLRFIEEKLGAGIWSWNLDTGAMEWSRGFFTLLGLEPGAVEPSYGAIESAMHPDDRQIQTEIERTLRDAVPVEHEFRIVSKAGRIRWVSNRAEPVINASGLPTRAVGVCFDVTKPHEALHLFKSRDERYRALVNMVDAVVFTAKADGTISSHPSWRRLQSEEPERFVGAEWWTKIAHPECRARTVDEWKKGVEARQRFLVEHRLLQPDGTYQWCRSQATPIFNSIGEIQEWIGISLANSEDITSDSANGQSSLLTGAQIRAGRAIAGWSVQDLAIASKVSPSAIRRFEEVDGRPRTREEAHSEIQRALEESGVEFIFSLNGKPGVRPR